MLVTMNILVILFIGGMIYWWGVQGFFSGFLHLLCVIAAGTIAFALWETVAQGLLMRGTAAHYAWCLGLLLPFIVLLLVLRLTLDRLIRKNMFFSLASNYAGGGLCGGIAGYLTAGITLLGLINLPWGYSMGGYQPYIVEGAGNVVVENSSASFWVSPEKGTAAFFAALSQNSLSSEAPMASFRPSPVISAVVNRQTLDPNASIVALPETVAAERYFDVTSGRLKEAGIDVDIVDDLLKSQPSGGRLVAVEVTFSSNPPGTFDNDSALRIAPPQVQLWGSGEASNLPLLPIAVALLHESPVSAKMITLPMEIISSTAGNSRYLWFYAVPAAFEPKVLMVRNTRLNLQAEPPSEDFASLKLALNFDKTIIVPPPPTTSSGKSVLTPMGGIVTNQVAKDYDLTDALPQAFSPNFAVGPLQTQEGRIISATKVTVRPPSGFQSGDISITKMSIPGHLQAVRILLDHSNARSVLGNAIVAGNLQAALLRDSNNVFYEPRGYALLRADRSYQIQFGMDAPIRSVREIPIADMKQGDQMYLYYAVERGVTLETFDSTPQNRQQFEPPLQLPR